MKPTIEDIRRLEAGTSAQAKFARRLWGIRETRLTRYAATSRPSQQKRRRNARRLQQFPNK